MPLPKNWKLLKYSTWKKEHDNWELMKQCRVCGEFTCGSICKDCIGDEHEYISKGSLPIVFLKAYLIDEFRRYRELEKFKLKGDNYVDAEAYRQKQNTIRDIMNYFGFYEELKIIYNEVK